MVHTEWNAFFFEGRYREKVGHNKLDWSVYSILISWKCNQTASKIKRFVVTLRRFLFCANVRDFAKILCEKIPQKVVRKMKSVVKDSAIC